MPRFVLAACLALFGLAASLPSPAQEPQPETPPRSTWFNYEPEKEKQAKFDEYNSIMGKLFPSGDKQKEYLVDYDAAVEQRPDDPQVYIKRAKAYYRLGETERMSKGYDAAMEDYGKALRDYGKAIELRPGSPETYHARGMVYDARGEEKKKRFATVDDRHMEEYAKAVEDYGKAIELKPDYYEAHRERARSLLASRRYKDGARDFERAIELDPTAFAPYMELAWLLATCPDPALHDGPRAVELASKALELHEAVNTMAARAAALARAGRFDEAVQQEERLVKSLRFGDYYPGHPQRLELYRQGKAYVEGE